MYLYIWLTDNEPGNKPTDPTPTVCTLSPCQINLYLLWDEYENGIGGRKPGNLLQDRDKAESSTTIIRGRYFGIA